MELSAQKFDQKISTANVILVDIEGTTSSISFVKDTLFPYALANVESFLKEQFDSDDIKEAIKALREQAKKDETEKLEGCISIPEEDAPKEVLIKAIVENVKWQMSIDRKVAPLKTLQGLIWSKAYKDKEIKGHVYADVSTSLETWVEGGRRVFVYSSGSVAAQKLLFGYSESGDLLKYFSGYFDTACGGKKEAESYKNILKEIKCEAQDIVFLTDVVEEAKAAIDAGLNAVIVQREGNEKLSEDDLKTFSVIKSFAELPLLTSGKRKPQDSGDEVPPTKIAKTIEVSESKAEDIKIVPDSTEEKLDKAVTVIKPETKTEEKMECDSVAAVEEPVTTTTEEKIETETKPENNTKLDKTEKVVEETHKSNETPEAMEVDAAPVTKSEIGTTTKDTEVENKIEKAEIKNVKLSEVKDNKVESEVKKVESEDKKEEVKGEDKVDRVEKIEITEIISSSVEVKKVEAVTKDNKVDSKKMEIEMDEIKKVESKEEKKKTVVEEVVVEKAISKVNDEIKVDSTTEKAKEAVLQKIVKVKEDGDCEKVKTTVSSASEEIKIVVEEKMDDSEVKSTIKETKVVDEIKPVTEPKIKQVIEPKIKTVTEPNIKPVTEPNIPVIEPKTVVTPIKVSEEIKATDEIIDEKKKIEETSKLEESSTEKKDTATTTMETDNKENMETSKSVEEKKKSEDSKLDDKVLKENSSESETKISEVVESKEIADSSSKMEIEKEPSIENGASSTVNGAGGDSVKPEEAKTNGADSDKENDNEKTKEVLNGSSNTTNGVAEESDVKVKKVVTDSPATPVVEATES